MQELVCHRCSGDLSQGTAAEAAGAAVAEFEVDAEGARRLAQGSVAAAVAAAVNGREAAHSVVAGLLVVEGSAEIVAAGLGLEAMREAEGMTDRLEEARSTAVGHVAGLDCISAMLHDWQCNNGVPYPPFSGGAGACQHMLTQQLY